jgi:flagellar export protein FliJ
MADLEPLIRLRKHTVDEKQKYLASILREAERVEAEKKDIQDKMAHEQKLAKESDHAESVAFLGNFLQASRNRIDKLNRYLGELNTRIEAAQEDMRAAFAEMKKIEIIHRNREKAERAEEEKKQSDLLDEIAIDGYRRNLDDE